MLSHWEFIQQSRPFDVLIIGSGITGCSAAIHMKKKDPMLRIGILESERLFMTTASTKNAGFACFGSLSELLEDEERKSVYNIIDGLFAKKKLKDTLSNALNAAL